MISLEFAAMLIETMKGAGKEIDDNAPNELHCIQSVEAFNPRCRGDGNQVTWCCKSLGGWLTIDQRAV
jgi:hypothetical protein